MIDLLIHKFHNLANLLVYLMVNRDQLLLKRNEHGAKLNSLKIKLFLVNTSLPLAILQIDWNKSKHSNCTYQVFLILFFKIAFISTWPQMQHVPIESISALSHHSKECN